MPVIQKEITIQLTEMEGALVHELISRATPKKELKRFSKDQFGILVEIMDELESYHITYDEFFNQGG